MRRLWILFVLLVVSGCATSKLHVIARYEGVEIEVYNEH